MQAYPVDAIFLAAIGPSEVRLPDGTRVPPPIIVGLRKELDPYAAIRSSYPDRCLPW